MKANKLIEISKAVSHALRHEPEAYGLKLDNEGWVILRDMMLALSKHGFDGIGEADIIFMVEQSEKKRHQIAEDRIRAYYGHSTDEKIIKQDHLPPGILFHGTSEHSVCSILEQGLKPMGRQYVHLSADKYQAAVVGGRKKGKTVILEIQALEARTAGVLFYREENNVWLSDAIPADFIAVLV